MRVAMLMAALALAACAFIRPGLTSSEPVLAAGFLGVPTERVRERDDASAALADADLAFHRAALEYRRRTPLRRLQSVAEELQAKGFGVVPARVEDVELTEGSQRVTVAAGYASGVPDNAIAVSRFRSLAGLVTRVEANRSHVLLISDPLSGVPAEVRSQEEATTDEDEPSPPVRGAVLGGQTSAYRSTKLLRFTYLEGRLGLGAGEVLETSGEGDVFPAGFPIGRVVGNPVTMERMGPAYAEVRPIADLVALREVLLVWPIPGSNVVDE